MRFRPAETEIERQRALRSLLIMRSWILGHVEARNKFAGRSLAQFLGSPGPPGVLGQLAHPDNLHTGLGHGVVIRGRAPTHADGSDKNAVLIHDGQAPWKGDHAVI